jgi:hypothetical protein
VNYWLLTLSLMNVLLLAFIAFNYFSKNKNRNEDQRLTKGLQLLQNKISILQDLSDKTDEQVRRWVHLIEQKSINVQEQLVRSDEKVQQIEQALSKALDISKIFYEQVPHAEMVERQKTSKYVQAAKLANQGFTIDQISQKIDLSQAEIEMITKLNREQLQFSEESLPGWVHAASQGVMSPEQRQHEVNEFANQLNKMNQMVSSTAFDLPKPDLTMMNQIKQQFTDSIAQNSTKIPQTFIDEKRAATETETKLENGKTVRPFEFRKIVK